MIATKVYGVDTKKTAEIKIRKWFLSRSDMIRFTKSLETELHVFPLKITKFADDKRFHECMLRLEKEFVRKEENNKKYNNLAQGKKVFTHYFFTLSKKIKTMLNKESLLYWMVPPSSRYFFALDDPIFYKGKKMIGGVIGHEAMVYVYLTAEEKRVREKEGWFFYKK